MEAPRLFHIYSARYRHAGRVYLAQIMAVDLQQATEVLWQGVVGGSPLLTGSGAGLDVEEFQDLGPATDVPYPEVLPDHPALLAVVVLEERPE
jgi:hypothetical protein